MDDFDLWLDEELRKNGETWDDVKEKTKDGDPGNIRGCVAVARTDKHIYFLPFCQEKVKINGKCP